MITQAPTKEKIEEWMNIWSQYKDKLQPNRKTGTELLSYLQDKYVLTEIIDKNAADAIAESVTMNPPNAERLPKGTVPVPRTFFLENVGSGEVLYKDENRDSEDIWGGNISRIFIGIDVVTGYYMVEGSTMLWDDLCAFQGLDEIDLQNFISVSQYIYALKRFDLLQKVLPE